VHRRAGILHSLWRQRCALWHARFRGGNLIGYILSVNVERLLPAAASNSCGYRMCFWSEKTGTGCWRFCGRLSNIAQRVEPTSGSTSRAESWCNLPYILRDAASLPHHVSRGGACYAFDSVNRGIADIG